MSAPNVGIEFPSITRVERPTYPVGAALQASLSPTAAVPLVMGEWLTTAGGVLARVGTTQATVPTYMWWEWQGALGPQALSAGAILLPPYRGWTLVYDGAGIPFSYGDTLSVVTLTSGTWDGHSVLQKTSGSGFVVARVIDPLPATATDRLYFHTAY